MFKLRISLKQPSEKITFNSLLFTLYRSLFEMTFVTRKNILHFQILSLNGYYCVSHMEFVTLESQSSRVWNKLTIDSDLTFRKTNILLENMWTKLVTEINKNNILPVWRCFYNALWTSWLPAHRTGPQGS